MTRWLVFAIIVGLVPAAGCVKQPASADSVDGKTAKQANLDNDVGQRPTIALD